MLFYLPIIYMNSYLNLKFGILIGMGERWGFCRVHNSLNERQIFIELKYGVRERKKKELGLVWIISYISLISKNIIKR